MLSLIPMTAALAPPARQRDGLPGALAPRSTAGPRCTSAVTYVRDPYAQVQKLSQLDKNVHFAQMTRIAPAGGGALGSHPARDPV